MSNTYDVIVIGAGAMGCAASWRLSNHNIRVLCLDQFAIPNSQGSSHGFSRAIRLAYYEHPDYVPLLLRSYELWEELQQATGHHVLNLTGGLYIGSRDSEIVQGSLASARLHGLRT